MPTPNVFKSGNTLTNGSIYKGQFTIGVNDSVGFGPTSGTSFWNGISPASGGYTIYQNKAANGPSITTAANNSVLVSTLQLIGSTGSTAANVLDWASQQSNIMVANIDYPSIVTSGLVSHLDAGFVSSYPTQGTTWRDLSNNGVNSILTNGPTYSTSDGGNIVFDGTNDYTATVAGQSFFQYTNQISVCWWVKRNGNITDGSGGGQSTINSDNMSTNVWLMHGLNTNTFQFYVNNNANWVFTTSSALLNNTWYYIVGTADSTATRIYVNGTQANSSSGVSVGIVNNSNSTVVWGADPRFTATRPFNGNIAMTSIYNRSLSVTEILQNYNATKSRFGL